MRRAQAGINCPRVQETLREVAQCIRHIHQKDLVHADVKPRKCNPPIAEPSCQLRNAPTAHQTTPHAGNFVRTIEDRRIKAIDFDATVGKGEVVGHKLSTGFAPPEFAKQIFASGPQASRAVERSGSGVSRKKSALKVMRQKLDITRV